MSQLFDYSVFTKNIKLKIAAKNLHRNMPNRLAAKDEIRTHALPIMSQIC